jgi:hypothetical protein
MLELTTETSMAFKATDLSLKIVLNDQKIHFAIADDPEGLVLAAAAAVTCGPTNPAQAYAVQCNMGFRDKDNFEKLKDALRKFMAQIEKIDVT